MRFVKLTPYSCAVHKIDIASLSALHFNVKVSFENEMTVLLCIFK